MSLLKKIQEKFSQGNMVDKFIFINIAIFIAVYLFNTLFYLIDSQENLMLHWLALPANFNDFLSKPWTLITYGFLHFSFLHILFNLIALYYIGNLFLDYFVPKQFITFYLLGTVFGGLIFLLSYHYFPVFSKTASFSMLLGASAGISAIFIGIATYLPNYEMNLRFIGSVKLWILAAIWVGFDVIQIPNGNAGGHLAHIGGALFGFLYVNSASNTKINLWSNILTYFNPPKKTLKTVYKSKQKNTVKTNKEHQQKIDLILDKISKSGYDTLTQEEKAFLFQQGKK